MMSQNEPERQAQIHALTHALQWQVDHGVDVIVMDTPLDKTAPPPMPTRDVLPSPVTHKAEVKPLMGAADAIIEAQKLAAACNTLDELSAAISAFDGLSLKKMATNMVFASGSSDSDIMVIGDAPAADDDIQGIPFVSEDGKLLDKILASIGLSRAPHSDQSVDKLADQRGAYLTNMLNWRPPGNRTPTDSEIAIALPFIERHIALVSPKILILCGGVAGKALMRRNDSISKLRGSVHDYQIPNGLLVKTIITYHPAYLLRTPAQKKAVWADMLMTQDYIERNL